MRHRTATVAAVSALTLTGLLGSCVINPQPEPPGDNESAVPSDDKNQDASSGQGGSGQTPDGGSQSTGGYSHEDDVYAPGSGGSESTGGQGYGGEANQGGEENQGGNGGEAEAQGGSGGASGVIDAGPCSCDNVEDCSLCEGGTAGLCDASDDGTGWSDAPNDACADETCENDGGDASDHDASDHDAPDHDAPDHTDDAHCTTDSTCNPID